MNFSINNNNAAPFENAENPNICPHCQVANEPLSLFKHFDEKQGKLISVWKCRYHKCGKIFAVTHKKENKEYIIERFLNGFPLSLIHI